jgi:hypothetical protein
MARAQGKQVLDNGWVAGLLAIEGTAAGWLFAQE